MDNVEDGDVAVLPVSVAPSSYCSAFANVSQHKRSYKLKMADARSSGTSHGMVYTKTVPEPLRGKHHVLWLEESPHHVQHGCFTDVHIGLRWALQRCVAGHQEVKSRCRDQRGLRGMTSYSLTRFSTRAVACAGANPPHRHIVLGRSPGMRAKCPHPCPLGHAHAVARQGSSVHFIQSY